MEYDRVRRTVCSRLVGEIAVDSPDRPPDPREPHPPGQGPSRVPILRWAVLVVAVTAVTYWFGTSIGGFSNAAIGVPLLLVLPFSIGALTELLLNPTNSASRTIPNVVVTIAIIIGVGAIMLREGVICIVILSPLWFLSALIGAYSVVITRDFMGRRDRSNVAVLMSLPLLAVLIDANFEQPVDQFSVSRSIVIDARQSAIWPHLLSLDGLTADEGVWNITQDVLGVPRPSSAVVVGEGVGSVRQAQWGANIRFEEHLTDWRQNERLAWDFSFPDDSISRYTDPHIHPDGANLKIAHGAYQLDPLPGGKARLTLETRYLARSPVNAYAAMWGELFLGDIQTNILAVVKARAER